MKRNLFLLVVFFLFLGSVQAQNHWTPVPEENGDAVAVIWAQVKIDGQLQTSGDIEVAMFFDDECRDTKRIKSWYNGNYIGVKLNEGYCSTVNCVYGGTPVNYQVTFKCYDHVSGMEYDECPTTYTANGGNLSVVSDDGLVLEFTTCFKKDIEPYSGNGGYYFIASPIGQVRPDSVTNMLTNSYDLYYFDQNQELEWINYEGIDGGFNLQPGVGYLYANNQEVTLKFYGSAYTGSGEVTLVKTDGVMLSGWNLVGNPYADTAYIDRPFYTLNDSRSEVIAEPITGPIPPMEGAFVLANQNNEKMNFTTTAPSTQGKGLTLTLSQGRGVIDRAIVDFNEGHQLPKFILNENNTKLFIVQENENYAVVQSDGQGEMPLNFKAGEDGTYIISVDIENIDMDYLHLIDNFTHTDIDLLQTPSYTFEANATDSDSRFTLEFSVSQYLQEPGCPWVVNPYATPNTATLVALVKLDGITIEDGTNWVLGAFCGEECRGIGGTTNVGWVYTDDPNVPYHYYMMMSVYGNTGDEITFKLYDKEADQVYPGVCDTLLTWQVNAMWGNFWTPAFLDFVTPTFTKHILPYTEKGGYYLISSPIGQVAPSDVTKVTGMLTNSYDLYYFDQEEPDGLEWVNYKSESGNFGGEFDLLPGKGYLYANSNEVDLVFRGMPPYNGGSDFEVTLVKKANVDMEGWNLVGNPFADTAYIDRPFYTRKEGGAEIIAEPITGPIAIMEGVFVLATEDDESMAFTTTQPANNGKGLSLNLLKSHGLVDRAIIRFGEEKELPKLQLNRDNTKLYIQQNGMDYAVVNTEAQGEVPVNFVAAENGTYTISVNAEAELKYLHLIDNFTGANIDLLTTPSYSFEAKTTDHAYRFKLVFVAGSAADDSFAFYSNGSFVINNEGPATVQVVDVTGRILSNEQIDGSCSISFNATNGVYMLRLVNGDNVKVQKVVVE